MGVAVGVGVGVGSLRGVPLGVGEADGSLWGVDVGDGDGVHQTTPGPGRKVAQVPRKRIGQIGATSCAFIKKYQARQLVRNLDIHGIIRRAPRTLRYTLTSNGVRAAFLYTTLYRRLRRPHASARAYPNQLPSRLDAALRHLDTVLQEVWTSPKPAA